MKLLLPLILVSLLISCRTVRVDEVYLPYIVDSIDRESEVMYAHTVNNSYIGYFPIDPTDTLVKLNDTIVIKQGRYSLIYLK